MIIRSAVLLSFTALSSPAFAGTYNPGLLQFATATPQSAWSTGNAQEVSGGSTISQTFDTRASFEGSVPGISAEGYVDIDGEVGIEFDYLASAGSVNPRLNFSASLDIPDSVTPDTYFHLGSAASNLASGAFNAVSPGFNASVSGILDVKIKAGAEACLGLIGCFEGSRTLIDIDETIEVLSVNNTEAVFLDGIIGRIDPTGTAELSVPVANATVQLWKGTPAPGQWPLFVSVNGVDVAPGFNSGKTPLPPFVELASGSIGLPNFDFSTGTIQDNTISASGSGRVIDVKLDLDGIATLINPTLPPGGAAISFGPAALNAAVTLDAFDAKAGPFVDLIQEFDILAGLDVTLDFDVPVIQRQWVPITERFCTFSCRNVVVDWYFEDVTVSSITSRWDNLDQIILKLATTAIVTPTFSINAALLSQLSAQLGLDLDVIFGKGSFNAGPFTAAFGPLLELDIPSYTPSFGNFDLFKGYFKLNGFDSIIGNPFTLHADLASTFTPPVYFTPPPIFTPPAPVPIPPTLAMSASALAILFLRRRRRSA